MTDKGKLIKTESVNHQGYWAEFINIMNQIKNILLGIRVILIVILIHLFIEIPLSTDFLAIIGIVIVLLGYFFVIGKNNSS